MFQRFFLVLFCLSFVSLSATKKSKKTSVIKEESTFSSLHCAVVSEKIEQVKIIIDAYRISSNQAKEQNKRVFSEFLMKTTICGRTAESLACDLELYEIYNYLKGIREEEGIALEQKVKTSGCCF